ncbi:hypothetical protein [Priestia megaterium]|uniref:hypothetical protein n=1 Tax=Priestia megaterium TaxID=1404 RepID=UPI0018687A5B|nr:hypothetical protein [Priestia megaterium]MBE2977797.1 hypothetical protein [Priestia megaterium]
MNLTDKPSNLYSPEYYMEIEKYDLRLAVLKVNDFLETLSDATISIIYSNKDEYPNLQGTELAFIRRIHTRHAVIDLNNCFDLLLQIPWFYYRIWQDFNPDGRFYNKDKNYFNKKKIIRNTDGWVESSEQDCNYDKIIKFLENQSDQGLLKFKTHLNKFKRKYIFNRNKKFTVRTITNQIKHNNSLKVKELQAPTELNVEVTPKKTINLKNEDLKMLCNGNFFDENNPQSVAGKISVKYEDDLYVDIEYKSGERFRGKDFVKPTQLYSLDDIYTELVSYRSAIISLYNELYKLIEPTLSINPSPLFKSINFKKAPSIDLDKYFKE